MQGLIFKKAIFFYSLFVVFSCRAQVEPPIIMPGVAPIYSSELNVIGINARVYYAMNHHLCFGPEVSYFTKNKGEEGKLSLFEANVNLHYILEIGKSFGVYPLGGFNYTIETETLNYNNLPEEHTESEFGINTGGGFHYAKGRFLLFSEYKYVISKLDDHFFTIGVLFNFPLSKKDKKSHF